MGRDPRHTEVQLAWVQWQINRSNREPCVGPQELEPPLRQGGVSMGGATGQLLGSRFPLKGPDADADADAEAEAEAEGQASPTRHVGYSSHDGYVYMLAARPYK